jgi:hypothetical protein
VELFRRNSEGFLLLQQSSDVTHAYLGYSDLAVQKQLTGMASMVKNMLGKNTHIRGTVVG